MCGRFSQSMTREDYLALFSTSQYEAALHDQRLCNIMLSKLIIHYQY